MLSHNRRWYLRSRPAVPSPRMPLGSVASATKARSQDDEVVVERWRRGNGEEASLGETVGLEEIRNDRRKGLLLPGRSCPLVTRTT